MSPAGDSKGKGGRGAPPIQGGGKFWECGARAAWGGRLGGCCQRRGEGGEGGRAPGGYIESSACACGYMYKRARGEARTVCSTAGKAPRPATGGRCLISVNGALHKKGGWSSGDGAA